MNMNLSKKVTSFQISENEFVDLQAMVTYNTVTKTSKKMGQKPIKNHQPKMRWAVKSDIADYVFLSEVTSDQIESYYQSYLWNAQQCMGVNYEVGNSSYFADFHGMAQINLNTNNERKLLRIKL
jgi:hypothetical protein